MGLTKNMNKSIDFLGLFVIIIVVSGCVPSPKTSCESQGGKRSINGNGLESCFIPTKDAGKVCTDKKECEGYCLAEKETDTAGTCSGSKTFSGCYYVFEGGINKGSVCD